MRNRQFGRRVCKVVAPYIGVCPDFMQGGAEARPLSCFQEVGYVVQQELVVVIVLCTRGTGLVWWCRMTWRLDRESVNMLIQLWVENLERAV